jgi:hypothetical protein
MADTAIPAGPTAIDRPTMPDGYGVPDDASGLLAWQVVVERLRRSTVYWMATTRPDGRPHVIPRWGVWLDLQLYYDGAPTTRHAANLRENPACAVHLEDGTRAVILEGSSAPAEAPGTDLGGRIAEEMTRKYGPLGYSPTADSWDGENAGGLCVFVPEKAMAWSSFPTDVTRYRFRAGDQPSGSVRQRQ